MDLRGWRRATDPLERIAIHGHNFRTLMVASGAADPEGVALHATNVERARFFGGEVAARPILRDTIGSVSVEGVGAIYGALDPKHAPTNLMTGVMCVEVASTASNLLMDIKPGYMLGAKPRQQAIGHCIGIVAGALASTPLFFLLFMANKTEETTIKDHVTSDWAVPGAIQWAAISDVIAGMGQSTGELVKTGADGIAKLWGVLPVSAAWAMLFGAVIAIVFEVLRTSTKGKFPLSAVGIGLGIVLPPESTVMMFTGACLFAFFENKYHKAIGSFGWKLWVDSKEAVCAGLIAGWALLGVGDGIIAAFGNYHDTTEEAEKAAAADAQKQAAALTPAELDAERAL
jgi:uncharacterized oligopeptide transporter (OPT) family protein